MKIELAENVTLIQGDCRDYLSTLSGISAVITDHPYNAGKKYSEHCDDKMSDKQYADWCSSVVGESLKLCARQFWVWPRYKLELGLSLLPNAHLVVIRRGASGPFRQGWSDQFEICLACGKPVKCRPDLWSDIRLKGEGYFFRENTYGHTGYTPSKIFERAISIMCSPGDTIVDPFMGTGTSGVNAIRAGVKYIGIESGEHWFRVAKERIEKELQQQLLPL